MKIFPDNEDLMTLALRDDKNLHYVNNLSKIPSHTLLNIVEKNPMLLHLLPIEMIKQNLSLLEKNPSSVSNFSLALQQDDEILTAVVKHNARNILYCHEIIRQDIHLMNKLSAIQPNIKKHLHLYMKAKL